MGYEQNDAVLVTSWLWDVSERGHQFVPGRVVTVADVEAFRQTMPADYQGLLVGPVQYVINGGGTFIFCPDGSKEGWDTSDELDEWRARFLALFADRTEDGGSYYDVVHVRWGGSHAGYFGATVEYANDEHHDEQIKAEREAAR